MFYTETVNSFFHLCGYGQAPQPYKHWCFGCRYYGYRYWLVHLAYEMLWLEYIVKVISHGLMGSPHFGHFDMACVLLGTFICWAYILVSNNSNMFYKPWTDRLVNGYSCCNKLLCIRYISAYDMCSAAHWLLYSVVSCRKSQRP